MGEVTIAKSNLYCVVGTRYIAAQRTVKRNCFQLLAQFGGLLSASGGQVARHLPLEDVRQVLLGLSVSCQIEGDHCFIYSFFKTGYNLYAAP